MRPRHFLRSFPIVPVMWGYMNGSNGLRQLGIITLIVAQCILQNHFIKQHLHLHKFHIKTTKNTSTCFDLFRSSLESYVFSLLKLYDAHLASCTPNSIFLHNMTCCHNTPFTNTNQIVNHFNLSTNECTYNFTLNTLKHSDMFRSCQIIIRELCSLLKLYYSIHNSIRICKRGVVAAYRVVWECVVEQQLGVRRTTHTQPLLHNTT